MGDQLAMTTDPAQPCSCGGGFVGKFTLDGHRIGAFRGGQRLGVIASGAKPGSQGCRQLIDAMIHPFIFVGVRLIGSALNTRHNTRVHGQRPGKGKGEALSVFIHRRGEISQIRRTP